MPNLKIRLTIGKWVFALFPMGLAIFAQSAEAYVPFPMGHFRLGPAYGEVQFTNSIGSDFRASGATVGANILAVFDFQYSLLKGEGNRIERPVMYFQMPLYLSKYNRLFAGVGVSRLDIHKDSGGSSGTTSPAFKLGLNRVLKYTDSETSHDLLINIEYEPWGRIKDIGQNQSSGVKFFHISFCYSIAGYGE